MTRAAMFDELQEEHRDAVALVRKMVAIHAAAYDAGVTAESYPGAAHEEAEERWVAEAMAWLGARGLLAG